MAHTRPVMDRRTTSDMLIVALTLTLLACGGVSPPKDADAPPPEPAVAFEGRSFGRFHSKRFALTLTLPDGKAWAIDDHSAAELRALHPRTHSELTVDFSTSDALMNRQQCEALARTNGWVPRFALRTVEDVVLVEPDQYDTRLWVAVEPPVTTRGPIAGHVFAFGGNVRRCLNIHYRSVVPSEDDVGVLSARIALIRSKLLSGITFDNIENVARQK